MEGRDKMAIILCPSCGGTENYHEPHCQQERDRLRAVNAKLLEALEEIAENAEEAGLDDEELRGDIVKLARAAIKEARK
jgi:hypothetical protein